MPDAAPAPLPEAAAVPPRERDWEWFWRFLALVLLVATGWVVWVALQMNPDPIATPAAFDAASRAAGHAAQGKIRQTPAAASQADAGSSAEGAAASSLPGAADAALAASPAESAGTSKSAELPYPPVNLNQLKRADALSTVSLGKLGKAAPVPTQQ